MVPPSLNGQVSDLIYRSQGNPWTVGRSPKFAIRMVHLIGFYFKGNLIDFMKNNCKYFSVGFDGQKHQDGDKFLLMWISGLINGRTCKFSLGIRQFLSAANGEYTMSLFLDAFFGRKLVRIHTFRKALPRSIDTQTQQAMCK